MKKIAYVLVILIILFNNIIYASSVNVDNEQRSFGIHIGGNGTLQREAGVYLDAKCMRVSIYDKNTKNIVNIINLSNIASSNRKQYSYVSNYNKQDLINYGNDYYSELAANINNGKGIDYTFYKDTLSFPTLIQSERTSDKADTIKSNIQDWFGNQNNIKYLVNDIFQITDLDINNIVILVEPMLAIKNNDIYVSGTVDGKNPYKYSLLTASEIGLLSLKGYKFYDKGDTWLGAENEAIKINPNIYCYTGLPYSCYKTTEGNLTSILPYGGEFQSKLTDDLCENMIYSLGCFEISIDEKEIEQPIATPPVAQHIEQEVVTQKFYTDTYVITSDMVSSTMGFPRQSYTPATNQDLDAKNGCLSGRLAQITFTFTCDEDLEVHNYTQSIAIPQNGQAVSWVRWKTPSKPCIVFLDITTNSEDAVLRSKEMIFEIIDEKTLYPPNAEATDRNDDFDPPDEAYGSWYDGQETENSWATFNYTWHYYWVWGCRRTQDDNGNLSEWGLSEHWDDDYVCDAHTCPENAENHTCPTGRCHSIQQDWGWVEWQKIIHTATLEVENVELVRSKNSPNTNNSNYSIKSGYGIEVNMNTYISNKIDDNYKTINYNNKEITPVQVLEAYMPEYKYKDYTIVSKDDNYTSNKDMHLPVNPYSQFEQNCHFTPLWYPDSDYVMGLRIGHCYTPAGELFICIRDTKINISGNVYDDWHIAPDRGKK